MKTLDSLSDVLHSELKDLMSAEKQLLKALPKIAKAVQSPTLEKTIKQHIKETEKQVARLEKIEKNMGIKLSGKTCEAMKGLIAEGEEILTLKGKNGKGALIDVLLVGACQRVEHYEMAAYGSACMVAEHLGHDEIAELLQETLDEEESAATLLAEVCEDELLPECADLDEEETEQEDIQPPRRTARAGKGAGAR